MTMELFQMAAAPQRVTSTQCVLITHNYWHCDTSVLTDMTATLAVTETQGSNSASQQLYVCMWSDSPATIKADHRLTTHRQLYTVDHKKGVNLFLYSVTLSKINGF